MNGYASCPSLMAAAVMELDALLETVVAEESGRIGFAFTTATKSRSAPYADLALASLTFDMRYSGTFGSTRGWTAL